jgi:excisionase family DNA binding protein
LALPLLLEICGKENHPSLKADDGTEIPEHVFQVLAKVVEQMRNGQAIVLLAEEEAWSTQAATSLGMSRQHFVTLLESGSIPFHRVGSPRRVTLKNLLEYEKRRDTTRREVLAGLFTTLQEQEYYETDYTGEVREGNVR